MNNHQAEISEYFLAPEPTFPTKRLVFGTIMILIGFALGSTAALVMIGIGAAVIGLSFLSYNNAKRRFEARPSDEQMDTWLSEYLQRICDQDAIQKLGLDQSDLRRQSLVIPGPVYWPVNGLNTDEVIRRLGKDGCYRYSVLNLEVFLFLKDYLANYGCTYNWLRNTSVNEHTNEFFYKDVVSIKAANESTAYTLKDGQRLEHTQVFQLNLSGDRVSVVTNDIQLKTSPSLTGRVDTSVQSIRAMLREKKASAAAAI